MFEIALDAKIHCTNGRGGSAVAVTLGEENRRISHIIVEDDGGQQRLVPFNLATKASHEGIWLNCSEKELKEMPLFMVTEFVERAPQESGDWADEEGEWEDGVDVSSFEMNEEKFGMPVVVERVPDGEIPFHRSTEIEATDGHVGKVDKLVVEQESGQITHLVMQKGHLWGKKEIAIPLSAVEDLDYESVYLNVDKKAVEELPELGH